MNAVTLVFTTLLLFVIAYRYYGLFIASKVLGVDPARPTPAVCTPDGHDFVKTNRFVLFGHHFAAISAAGPLLGPVLAAQFGFLPGALWILIGAVLAGAVHDMVILFASVRRGGKSLPVIAELEIGKITGKVASVAVLFIIILAMAGLSIALVNALYQSVWGAFTIFSTIPIAILMGIWMEKLRPGDVAGASAIGVTLLLLAVAAGPWVTQTPWLASHFALSKKELSLLIPAY
ncbi:MAG: carbon starvation protein A, partial [Nitrospinota bacterium]|nr:carbon starvation protein A [Nitrospinota bacterium]